MDAMEQLKKDVREGRIGLERVFVVMEGQQRQLEMQQQQLETLQRELKAAKQRIEELEKKLSGPTPPATAKVDQPFSMQAEEKRQQARQQHKKVKLSKKGRRGRLTTADKIKLAERPIACFPEGVLEQDCHLSHVRPVWRLIEGRAVLIAYQIYRGPHNQYGKIPGVLGRSEFGLEIVIEVAYFVYVHGPVFRQGMQDLAVFAKGAAGEDPGRRVAAASVPALAKRVRGAVHAAGQLAGGSCRRNQLEHQQRLGISVGESAGVVFWRAQGCGHAQGDSRSADVCRPGDQRRCGGLCQLQSGAKVLGASAAQGDQTDAAGAK